MNECKPLIDGRNTGHNTGQFVGHMEGNSGMHWGAGGRLADMSYEDYVAEWQQQGGGGGGGGGGGRGDIDGHLTPPK